MIRQCEDCNVMLNIDSLHKKCHKCLEESKASKSKTGSLRLNNGKPEITQLDPKFIMDLADLMTKSSDKYGKYNWALGQEYLTPSDSLMRHMLKFLMNEDLDKDSKMNHILHVAANAMIIYRSMLMNDKDLDNRYNWGYSDEQD